MTSAVEKLLAEMEGPSAMGKHAIEKLWARKLRAAIEADREGREDVKARLVSDDGQYVLLAKDDSSWSELDAALEPLIEAANCGEADILLVPASPEPDENTP